MFWTVYFMGCLLLLTVLTTAVRNLHTLEWLDLTACSLSAQGAASTAALIKVQPCFIFAKVARLLLSSSLVPKHLMIDVRWMQGSNVC